MSLKISRRPYQTCPYRWSLTVAGIDTGEGTVSDAQCLDINGDEFNLDFVSCQSQHDRLVWAGECVSSSPGCADCDVEFTVTVPDIGIHCFSEGNLTFAGYTVVLPFLDLTGLDSSGGCRYGADVNQDGYLSGVSIYVTPRGLTLLLALWHRMPNGFIAEAFARYESRPGATCDIPGFFDLIQVVDGSCQGNGFPSSLTVTSAPTGVILAKPDFNDRVRSKWHLDYLIAETKWVLRSFGKFQYPTWSLSDADPCTGNTKTLTLEDRPEGAENGCANAPAEVTITRACPPDRVAREHSRNKRTGQLRRPCGCACDDEVDDRRHTCQAKCVDTETVGCESYDADQIACKYPKSSDCCTYCPEDTAPCAYEALTTCDLSHDGIPIMAKTVTLRHKCYFDDTCDWVAVGPSPNAKDGGLGAQPVCATCVDPCLSGCSWDAWQTATCPQGPCGPNLCDEDAVFTYDMPALNDFYTGLPCTDAETFTFTYNTGYWVCITAQFSAYMRLQENCVSISIETVGSFIDCTFGCEGEIYFGTPTSGGCPNEFVFTLLPQCVGFGYPTTITVTRV